MKATKAIVMVMGVMLMASTPALAQRNGGGSTRSSSGSMGGHSSSSMGSTRSSSSSMGSTRSSSSSMSTRSSSSSMGSTRSSSSSMGSTRSSSSSMSTRSSSSSMGSPRSSSSSINSRSSSSSISSRPSGSGNSVNRSVNTRSNGAPHGTGAEGVHKGTPGADRLNSQRSNMPNTRSSSATAGSMRQAGLSHNYARPGHPGGHMPPSSRPIHPAPYFHHPWHNHVVHCHPIYWDPMPLRAWYWPGFWVYCHSYWYDYHVTDVVVVHDYVKQTYSVDLVTYGISGDIMYAIVRDDGSTYLQVYDNSDHLLAEQKINKKYCNMVIDPENGGCWISKKDNRDALLFIWADGQLLIYEED